MAAGTLAPTQSAGQFATAEFGSLSIATENVPAVNAKSQQMTVSLSNVGIVTDGNYYKVYVSDSEDGAALKGSNTYFFEKQAGSTEIVYDIELPGGIGAGDYYVVVENGNGAKRSQGFEIAAAADMQVEDVASVVFDNTDKTPSSLVVTANGIALEKGVDYTVELKDADEAVDAGTYTAVVKSIAGSKYVASDATAEISFEVTPCTELSIAAIDDQEWTGKAVEPAISVSGVVGDDLVENADYTFEYSDNIAAGKATVTVSGKGNYEGAIAKQSFNIVSQTATDADYFSMGEVVEVVDNEGHVISSNADGAYEISLGDSLDSVSVMPAMLDLDEPVKVTAGIQYAKSAAGKDADELAYGSTAPDETGTWYAKVPGTGSYAGGAVYVELTVTSESAAGIYAFDNNDGEKDVTDKEFTYSLDSSDNKTADLGFAIDGKVVDATIVALYKDGSTTTTSDFNAPGNYSAKVELGSEYGNAVKWVNFTVNKLDLSSVNFVVDDIQADGSAKSPAITVAGTNLKWSDMDKVLSYKVVSGPTAPMVAEKGSYELEISALNDEAEKLVEGTSAVTFNVAETVVGAGSFEYDGDTFAKNLNDAKFVNAEDEDPFDPSLVKVVKDGSNPAKPVYYKSSEYTVVVEKQNADKTWSKVDTYTTPGSYRVTAQMVTGSDFALAGKAVGTFTVTNGNLNFNDVFVTWNGEAVTDGVINATYDGEDVIDEIGLTVRYGDKTLVAGTDYKVEYTLDGEAVDSIVNAGDYKMTITPLTYDGAKTVVDIHVGKLPVTDVRVDSPDFMDQGKLAYTGTDIDFAVEAQYGENLFASPDYESTVLPTDVYKVSGLKYKAKATDKDWTSVDSVKEVGLYTATVTIYGDADNYSGTSYTINFEVAKNVAFADVAADAWYAEAVATAADANHEYMNGIGGTNLFLPLASITRAQVAQVFYNMAGNRTSVDNGNAGFDDVNEIDWYEGAVAWAATAGVVKGYDGTNSFGPNDNATREQVATMIYRYAGVVGLDTSVEDESAALAKYADGSSVSEFAKTAMAWCVEQGIFGVDVDTLRPQDNLCRAEMAATAVRVQPEGFIKPVA